MRSRAVRRVALALLATAPLVACGSQLDVQRHRTVRSSAPAPAASPTQLQSRAISKTAPPGPTTTTTRPRRPGPPRILVIGDSLVTLSAAPLEYRLRAAGWAPTVIGLNGWRLDEIDVLYRAIDRAAHDWDAVVMWAGNNDILQSNPWRLDLQQAAQLVSRERCGVLMGIGEVYWAEKLGVPRPATPMYNPQAQAFNAEAIRLAHRDRLGFIPWQHAIHTTQPWFHWDLLHVTPAGADHAAELITRAAHPCLP